jgi:hypothetical protein
MDEASLIDKVRRIEALFAGAATDGERVAAERARQRILQRLELREQEDPPAEYRFPMADVWLRTVFVALLRRYGIRPYRYRGQRHTTVMARVPKRFVDETLWPEFQQISHALQVYLSEVTDRVVSQVIHQDGSDAEVVDKPKQLSLGLDQADPPVADQGSPPAADTTAPQGSASESAAGGNGAERRTTNTRKKRKKRKRR